jgi:hypothetical protein
MGFSCPVCEDPQADGVHLANHLAITAMARGGDHEEFLDEHVPNWQELGETALAEQLRSTAEEMEYPQVFEDTTGDSHNHSGEASTQHRSTADSVPFEAEMPDDPGDGETEEIMQEAMELTRQRRANGTEESDDDEPETE